MGTFATLHRLCERMFRDFFLNTDRVVLLMVLKFLRLMATLLGTHGRMVFWEIVFVSALTSSVGLNSTDLI